MTTAKKQPRRRNPDLATMHPGEFIELQYLEPLAMTPDELARRLKSSAILQVLKRKRGITADLALRLAKLFRTNAEFWMNVQNHYDLRTAAAKTHLGGIRPMKTA
jgi:addiction module HigA family antidote